MEAGFAKVKITPPLGTTMIGWGVRDRDHGCEKIHDDIFVRALFLEHQNEKVLILAFDLCFFNRPEVDRYKGAIGRWLDLPPRNILINTSHTHVGPSTARWSYTDYISPPDPLYLSDLEAAAVSAARQAAGETVEVTVWGGETQCNLPISRRLMKNGKLEWRPSEAGTVYDKIPLCLLKDNSGKPFALLFSVACHPSMIGGYEISAEFPGVAMDRLDAWLGRPGSLFLQGAGGDAKPRLTADGENTWRPGTWPEVTQAGEMVAHAVIQCLETATVPLEPVLRSASEEMNWPLRPSPVRAAFEKMIHQPAIDEVMSLWARRQIQRLDRGEELRTCVPITAHGLQVGKNLRLVGIEGELVAGLGHFIRRFYPSGITFPLGYTDGTQLYLPTESMLDEGGYEVDSFYEYGFPSPLAPGFEAILLESLQALKKKGIT